jgi:predicted dehydrogenase
MLPFNENRFHYTWHWNWNYGTGDMGNDGVHQLDIARWALGVTTPVNVSGMARMLFFDDDQQTPETMEITFDYPGKAITWEMRIWNPYAYSLSGIENGVDVYGSEGFVRFDDGFKAYGPKGTLIAEAQPSPDLHVRNFIDCVKSGKSPNASVEIGHASTLLCHLGNIVARTGRPLKLESGTEKIAGDDAASQLLGREYRRHWSTPVRT